MQMGLFSQHEFKKSKLCSMKKNVLLLTIAAYSCLHFTSCKKDEPDVNNVTNTTVINQKYVSGIYANGVLSSANCQITQAGTGSYNVFYTDTYTTIPAVTASVYMQVGDANNNQSQIVKVLNATTNSCTIQTYTINTDGSTCTQANGVKFSFMVIGE